MQNNQFIQLDDKQSLEKLSSIFNSANYYIPTIINKKQVVVYTMSRDSYTSSTFLDKRTIAANTNKYIVSAESIRQLYNLDDTEVRPLNYIFHTAFCGSTLMCRALDKQGVCLPYKEPYLLHQFSLAKRKKFKFEMEMSNPSFLEISVKLLGRSFSQNEVPVIKPTDTCVNLTDELINLIPGSKGILLYEKLDEFILSGLKSPSRRSYIRDMVQRAKIDLSSMRLLNDVNTELLSDAQAAAYVWLGMMYMYQMAITKNKETIKTLYSGDFFSHPLPSLKAVAGHFNLNLSESDLREVCDGDIFKRNSKNQDKTFILSDYQQEMKKTADKLTAEIKEGLDWASKQQTEYIIPDKMPNSLQIF